MSADDLTEREILTNLVEPLTERELSDRLRQDVHGQLLALEKRRLVERIQLVGYPGFRPMLWSRR